MLKSHNPWLACFGTRTFLLDGIISLAKRKIRQEDLEKINIKLQAVKDKAFGMREKYNWNPPDELKQELLAALQNIIE